MSFDGMSFSVDKVSLLDCPYGEHYWKEKQDKKKKCLKLQGSHKIGCHARIRTHTHTCYTLTCKFYQTKDKVSLNINYGKSKKKSFKQPKKVLQYVG